MVLCVYLCLGVAEYCEDELFTAECQRDEVILVESALYGRMQLGRCVSKVQRHFPLYILELIWNEA